MRKKRSDKRQDIPKEEITMEEAFEEVSPAEPVEKIEEKQESVVEEIEDVDQEDVRAKLNAPAVKAVKKSDWKKDVTIEEVAKAEKAGTLIGFDVQENGLYSIKVK